MGQADDRRGQAGDSGNGPSGRESRRSQRSRIIGKSKECPYLNDAITRWTNGNGTFEENLIEAAMLMSFNIRESQRQLTDLIHGRVSTPARTYIDQDTLRQWCRDNMLLDRIEDAMKKWPDSGERESILGIVAERKRP